MALSTVRPTWQQTWFKLADMTLLTLPCAACHGMAYVSVFSGKIVSGINVVVRTDNQSVPKMNLWLSVTIFGCLGQPDNHYYEPWPVCSYCSQSLKLKAACVPGVTLMSDGHKTLWQNRTKSYHVKIYYKLGLFCHPEAILSFTQKIDKILWFSINCY